MHTMTGDKINSKIEDLEAELQKLKKLANEPEKRTPEAGDVWEDNEGFVELIAKGGKGVGLRTGYVSLKEYDQYPAHSSDTYLGKHYEVYVNRAEFISDIRAALSHLEQSRKALRKLNIITD